MSDPTPGSGIEISPRRASLRPRDLAALGVSGLYVAWLVVAYDWHFVDGANLLFHEAGHVFFGVLGQTVGMLGGTLGQLLVPALVVGHLLREGRPFEARLAAIWLGENLLNVARYMADAKAMALPLVGGDVHDWNWILGGLGLVDHCTALARLVHGIGLAVAIGAWLAAWNAAKAAAAAASGLPAGYDPRAPLAPREPAARS